MTPAVGVAATALSLGDMSAWLQASRLSHVIAQSNHLLVAGLQIIHVFGLIFLLAPLLLMWARQMERRGPGFLSRQIIASGLLRTEADAVSQAFAYGYDESRRMEQGDWAALLLTRRQPR